MAGLAPWQAKKLYVGNIAASEGYTLALDTSVVDPALGMSYQQFAMQGLRHQLSQGAADFTMRTGLHYYRLVDSALSAQHRPRPMVTSRISSMGSTLLCPALAERLGDEQAKMPELKQQLAAVAAEGGRSEQSGRSRPAGGDCAAMQGLRVASAADGARRACRTHARG